MEAGLTQALGSKYSIFGCLTLNPKPCIRVILVNSKLYKALLGFLFSSGEGSYSLNPSLLDARQQ